MVRLMKVVGMRFFGGLTIDETVLGVPLNEPLNHTPPH